MQTTKSAAYEKITHGDIIAGIANYLRNRGVDSFWTNSAVEWIRKGLVTNSHFPVAVRNPRVTVKEGHVARFTADVEMLYPDSGDAKHVKFTYAFNTRKHSVSISR